MSDFWRLVLEGVAVAIACVIVAFTASLCIVALQ
jgi:hypothetical protein